MTATTHSVREQGVMVMECDIPDGMTIAEYRASRHGKALRPERLPLIGLLRRSAAGRGRSSR